MPLAKKYVHWISREALEALRARLLEKKIRMTPIRSVPCKGLSDAVDVGFVLPEEWNKTCRRQGSWYRQSDRNGFVLVLSSEPLDKLGAEGPSPEAVIEPCEFETPPPPDAAARKALAEDPDYRRRAPAEWFRISDEERRYWDNLVRKIGGTGTLDEWLETHNANHAAFFTAKPGGGEAPHSIARSAGVCSACVELFDLHPDLRRHPVKYVMPCPGLVLFGGAPKDAWLKVTRLQLPTGAR